MPGIFAKLFGTSESVKAIKEPIEAVGNILDNLFTSKEEVLTLEEAKMRLAQKPQMAQVEINKLEAQHRSPFVAGWRPFIGYVCGVSLATYFIPQFSIGAYIWAVKCLEGNELLPYPSGGADGLMELVMAMLGMGLMRMAEKFGKVAK